MLYHLAVKEPFQICIKETYFILIWALKKDLRLNFIDYLTMELVSAAAVPPNPPKILNALEKLESEQGCWKMFTGEICIWKYANILIF